MDYWVFSKKDFSFIADLMVQTLSHKPDNSELSVIELFQETLQAEYVEGKDSDGDEVKGLRISDIELVNGKRLHDIIPRWDYENGVWKETIKQGFNLLKIFARKIKRAGYIIDGSQNYGLYKGWPWGLRKFYRNKANLISSFDGVERCFAIQAGREIRIIVKPDKIKDDDMVLLARDICKKIEEEVEYPGQIKVNIIRESRAIEYAR